MKVRALVSFCGIESMAMGEVKNIDKSIAKDLLRAGYIEEIKTVRKKSDVKEGQHERNIKSQ